MSKKKVAIIGTGTLGRTIATEIPNQLNEYYELVGLMKHSKKGIKEIENEFQTPVVTTLDDLFELSPDFIVEAASIEVVKEHGKNILERGIHFIPLSVGGLVDESFYTELQQTAKENQSILYIPSGAIGGFDIMRKMALADTPEVTFTSNKPPQSLARSPYMKNRNVSETEKEVVFEGTAAEAIQEFPTQINVAVATAIATVGPEKTKTVISHDPNTSVNTHEITLENKAASVYLRFSGQPSENPSSSEITAWSVLSLLQNIASPVRFF